VAHRQGEQGDKGPTSKGPRETRIRNQDTGTRLTKSRENEAVGSLEVGGTLGLRLWKFGVWASMRTSVWSYRPTALHVQEGRLRATSYMIQLAPTIRTGILNHALSDEAGGLPAGSIIFL
jgi:hypothetical protein